MRRTLRHVVVWFLVLMGTALAAAVLVGWLLPGRALAQPLATILQGAASVALYVSGIVYHVFGARHFALERCLEQAESTRTITDLEAFRRRCECRWTRICGSLMFMRGARDREEALRDLAGLRSGLDDLHSLVRQRTDEESEHDARYPPGILEPLMSWVQRDLAQACDGTGWAASWFQPGEPRWDVEATTTECYGMSALYFTADDQRTLATQHCTQWLQPDRHRLRILVIGSVLPALLRVWPADPGLLQLYKRTILEGTGTEGLSEEQLSVVEAAINGLAALRSVSKDALLDLLLAGLQVAGVQWRHWDRYGGRWRQVVSDSLDGDRLGEAHVRLLASRTAAVIKSAEPDILKDPQRQEEYQGLGCVIVALHRVLGVPNRDKWRPKHRHVVPDNMDVQVDVRPLWQGAVDRPATGRLVNFLGRPVTNWKAGAFVTFPAHPGWPGDRWRPASLTITVNWASPISLHNVQICGPEGVSAGESPHGHQHALRIEFGELPEDAFRGFEALAKQCPVTR